MLEMAGEIAAEQPPEELARWARPWKQRWWQARSRLAWRLNNAGPPRQNGDSEINEIDKRAERLGAAWERSTPMAPADLELRWRELDSQATSRWTVKGSRSTITATYPQAPSGGVWPRWILASLVAAAAVWFSQLAKGTAWPKVSRASMAMFVGVLWWFCLSPPALGLAIASIALGARLRQGSASAQLRASRSSYLAKRELSVG
jgi:hypothetical protein